MEVLKKSIPSKYISYFARHNTAANLIFVLMIVLGFTLLAVLVFALVTFFFTLLVLGIYLI